MYDILIDMAILVSVLAAGYVWGLMLEAYWEYRNDRTRS